MSEKNIASAVAYYQAMNNKDLAAMEKYLHPEVRLIGPLSDITGKDALLNSVKYFMAIFNKLTIRTQFGTGDQVVVVYELDCPEPIGHFRGSAALITFQEGLIRRFELFFDPRPFEKKS